MGMKPKGKMTMHGVLLRVSCCSAPPQVYKKLVGGKPRGHATLVREHFLELLLVKHQGSQTERESAGCKEAKKQVVGFASSNKLDAFGGAEEHVVEFVSFFAT